MEKRKLIRILTVILYGIGVLLLGLIIGSWFIDYPEWLTNLLTNTLLVGLGLVLLYQAFRIRNRDRKFAMIYLVIGIVLITVALASVGFVKIIAVAGLVVFLLTRPFVKKEINKNNTNA